MTLVPSYLSLFPFQKEGRIDFSFRKGFCLHFVSFYMYLNEVISYGNNNNDKYTVTKCFNLWPRNTSTLLLDSSFYNAYNKYNWKWLLNGKINVLFVLILGPKEVKRIENES